jgi:hypothetical protein
MRGIDVPNVGQNAMVNAGRNRLAGVGVIQCE